MSLTHTFLLRTLKYLLAGPSWLVSRLLSSVGAAFFLSLMLLLGLLPILEPLPFDLWLTRLDRQLVGLYAQWLGQPSGAGSGLLQHLLLTLKTSQPLPIWACLLSTSGSDLPGLVTPPCSYLVQVLLWAGLLVTATLLAWLPLQAGALATLLVLVLLALLQVQAYQLGWYLPVSAQALGFLAVVIMLRSVRVRRQCVRHLTAEVCRQRRQLLQLHIAARDDSSAFAVMRAPLHGRFPTAERDAYCQALYQWAEDLQARSREELAREIFQHVHRLHRRYRDVGERLRALQQRQDSDVQPATDALPLDATLPLDSSLPPGDAAVLADTVPLSAAALPAVSNAIPRELGRYQIERELGRGASGVVYLGHDPRIGRQVAVKTMNFHNIDTASLPALRERFAREAEAAGRLRHPSIVTVFDVGETPECAFIAMEYIDGQPLSEYAQSATLLPVATVYHIMAQVADALHYAHAANIIHRDVKPGNILWDEHTQQASVSDFGIARISDQSRTRTGEIMGSPLYMAPEQLKGSAVGPAADIFSLGVTFYQLLTGQPPFDGDNLANLSYQIMHGKHKPVRKLRPELTASATRIINRALQKDPRDRYASAGEMAEALRTSLRRDFNVKV